MSDDPMADFLAREKAALGSSFLASSEVPGANEVGEDADFFNNPSSSAPPAPAASGGFDDFGKSSPPLSHLP
jgi:hypothetical protein